jgi:hypothetical protein
MSHSGEISPYLAAAIERCKLPISVEYCTYNHQARRDGARNHFEIWWHDHGRIMFSFRDTPESASRVYLNLCSTLTQPAVRAPSDAHAVAPGSVSPMGSGALFPASTCLILPDAATDGAGDPR